MATALKIKNDIKKLKAAIVSKKTPSKFLPKLKEQLKKAENELSAMKKSGRPRKVSTTKGTQKTLSSLQKLVQKKKFGIYKGAGVDLKKDAGEGAFAVGRRVSKGLKANQFGSKKNNKGNVYYEYRPNRLDVKQPRKQQSYPKLAHGGEIFKEDFLKKTIVYDNGGESFDRYTIFTPDGSVYGMSENAQGFNQYLGESDEIEKGSHLGKKLKSVPKDIEWAVMGRMEYKDGGYMAKGGMIKKWELKPNGRYFATFLIDKKDPKYREIVEHGVTESIKEVDGGYQIIISVTEEGKEYFEKNFTNSGYMAKGGGVSDDKVRFDMYGYVHANDRTQSGDEIIRVSSYKEAEEKAENFLKENQYQLVELYRKDDFVGSIRTKGNFVYSSRYKKEDFASGGYMAKGGEVNKKVKDWYIKTYPKDDLGEEINDKITFKSLWAYMNNGYDVYEVLEVGDSIVRERVFEKLSEVLGVDYDVVYNKWLMSAEKGGMMAKGGEVDKELIDSSAKSIYEKKGMMALRNTFLQVAKADENSGDKETAEYRRKVISEYQSKQPKFMADGGELGEETITLKSYNIHGKEINSGDVIVDYYNKTIKLPNGNTYKVENDYKYTIKVLKSKIKASGGLLGLVEFLKEINNSDSPFNPSFTNQLINGFDKYADGGKIVGYKMYYEPQKNLGGKSIQSEDDIRGNFKAMDAVLDKKLGDSYLGSNFYKYDGYGLIVLDSEKSKDQVKSILEMFDFEDATSKYAMAKGGKTEEDEKEVIRGYFEDEPYEYAKGGKVISKTHRYDK